MKVTYGYAAADGVVQEFASCSSRDRRELLRVFDHLASHPFQKGDYVQRTASLRPLEVKRFGKWLVTFWTDRGAAEVRILEVRRLAA